MTIASYNEVQKVITSSFQRDEELTPNHSYHYSLTYHIAKLTKFSTRHFKNLQTKLPANFDLGSKIPWDQDSRKCQATGYRT